jgi:hypothetical protein
MDVTVTRRYKAPYYYNQLGRYEFIGITKTNVHIEKGRLYGEDLPDENLTVIFSTPFDVLPIGYVRCYRMVENAPGMWVQQDVLHYHPSSNWLRVNGFDVTIDINFESLSGVIIEYMFL